MATTSACPKAVRKDSIALDGVELSSAGVECMQTSIETAGRATSSIENLSLSKSVVLQYGRLSSSWRVIISGCSAPEKDIHDYYQHLKNEYHTLAVISVRSNDVFRYENRDL